VLSKNLAEEKEGSFWIGTGRESKQIFYTPLARMDDQSNFARWQIGR
jgi:hypothetical protein